MHWWDSSCIDFVPTNFDQKVFKKSFVLLKNRPFQFLHKRVASDLSPWFCATEKMMIAWLYFSSDMNDWSHFKRHQLINNKKKEERNSRWNFFEANPTMISKIGVKRTKERRKRERIWEHFQRIISSLNFWIVFCEVQSPARGLNFDAQNWAGKLAILVN